MKGFSFSATLEGLSGLLDKLRGKQTQSLQKDQGADFSVGYTAGYAASVHERMDVYRESGQAKFLEDAMREKRDQLRSEVASDARGGIGLRVATENAARTIYDRSQELVPVDTGALKTSGYIEDAQGNVIEGTKMTAEEIKAFQQLIKNQQRARSR